MAKDNVPFAELRPGVTYRIDIDDCCAKAELFGVFRYYNHDEDDEIAEAVFDIGIIGPTWGQITMTEVVTTTATAPAPAPSDRPAPTS